MQRACTTMRLPQNLSHCQNHLPNPMERARENTRICLQKVWFGRVLPVKSWRDQWSFEAQPWVLASRRNRIERMLENFRKKTRTGPRNTCFEAFVKAAPSHSDNIRRMFLPRLLREKHLKRCIRYIFAHTYARVSTIQHPDWGGLCPRRRIFMLGHKLAFYWGMCLSFVY